MSADNGVYVIKTKRTAKEGPKGHWTNRIGNFVYRVAHAQAIDNLEWYKEKQPYNLGAYMKDVWGASEVFDDESAALISAHKLAKSIGYLEYGVNQIDMSEYIFYGDL